MTRSRHRIIPRDRRGYFFTLDVFIAASIIMVALLLVLGTQIYAPTGQVASQLSEDLTSYILFTKMREIPADLKDETAIEFDEYYVIEQLAVWESDGEFDKAYDFILNVTNSLVGDQLGYMVKVDNTVLFNRSLGDMNESKFVIANHKMIYLLRRDGTQLGPVAGEVIVWERT